MSHHLIVQPDISINKMKRLTDILRKNGFTYSKILREGNVAIYEQHYSKTISYFEVFLIRVKPEQNLFGRFYPEKEVFPGNSDFGRSAFSYYSLDRAKERFDLLVQKEKNNNPQQPYDSS